jgi:NADPH:quinone reductase-like Zn-dependent oxidoreductase
LIRIYAASVAIEDADMRRGMAGQSAKVGKPTIAGTCLAGEIESVGRKAKRFKAGDQVYGFTGFFGGLGAHAEYLCMPEKKTLAPKPTNMTYVEAASLIDGGLTSLPFLRDKGEIKAGDQVLVNGASGAVGSAGVMLAKSFGAQVTGVCSTAKVEMVKALGADPVIDYKAEDFTQNGELYDIIFDAAGKSSFARCKNSLTKNGIYLSTVPMPDTLFHMLRTSWRRGKKVRFAATGLMPARKKVVDLRILTELAEAGQLKAVIDQVYPLEQVVEAHRRVESGDKFGNVILTMTHE